MTEENINSVKNKKPKVLLIEDDPILVKMYKVKFESEGFEVLTADDGEQGLEMALSEGIDVIVLDIMMPKMSGIDLLTKLRKSPKGKKVIVIMLTNLSQQEEQEKALELGAVEYLVKANQTPSQVVEKIKTHLTKKA